MGDEAEFKKRVQERGSVGDEWMEGRRRMAGGRYGRRRRKQSSSFSLSLTAITTNSINESINVSDNRTPTGWRIRIDHGGGNFVNHWFGLKTNFESGPYILAHGTSVLSGISILKSGGMVGSPSGKIGSGVYGIKVEGDYTDETVLMSTWHTLASSGYNGGCLVVLRAEGCAVKRMPVDELAVPSGLIAQEGTQWCANPNGIMPIHIVFDLQCIVGELGSQLDTLVYTREYHAALLNAEKALHQRRGDDKQKPLPNSSGPRKSSNAFEKVWVRRDDGSLAAAGEDGELWGCEAWAEYEFQEQQRKRAVARDAFENEARKKHATSQP